MEPQLSRRHSACDRPIRIIRSEHAIGRRLSSDSFRPWVDSRVFPQPAKRKVLCGYPDCPGAADYAVSFPAQDPVLYCTEHAETSIHRATGQLVALAFVLEATRGRDARVQRSRGRHIHWPRGGRVDGLSGGGMGTPRRDRGVCGGVSAGAVLCDGAGRGHVSEVPEASREAMLKRFAKPCHNPRT